MPTWSSRRAVPVLTTTVAAATATDCAADEGSSADEFSVHHPSITDVEGLAGKSAERAGVAVELIDFRDLAEPYRTDP